ncbi:hypothetical protein QBC35DRAFT_265565 [Podospora australis]|uniref:Spp2/MOS2 G-patch domain-containing protein n=1 Tax=Podospora australis TaxID=1536484 RepID=A0AAN7AGR8_9PEZI|nr:hypothetical protein QBC35DRAFT_265565 [Podospora australis]
MSESRDHRAPPRVTVSLGSGVKQRSRPAFGKRHRANGSSNMQDDVSDSDNNESGDDQVERQFGRKETILTYGDDYDLSDSKESSKRQSNKSQSHDQHRSRRNHDRDDDDDSRRRCRSEERSLDRRDNRRDDRKRDDRTERDRRSSRSPEPKVDDKEKDKKPVKWGLTINMKGAKAGNRDRGEDSKSGSRAQSEDGHSGSEDGSKKPATQKNIEDEALDALMGATAAPKKRKLGDLDAAADREPQAQDYQALPIDDFGATLLRGMGWDGKMRGKVREVKRHANLTGLGAKDVKGNEDLGAWDPKGVVKKDSRPVRLNDYRKEEDKKRQRLEDRRGDNSYRRELERDRERGHGRDR